MQYRPRTAGPRKEPGMKPRLEFWKVAPGAYKAMSSLDAYLRDSGIDMHWKDARAAGESEQRLYGLDAWREASYYTDRERAALEWTEALTNITDGHVSDAVYDAARGHFSDKELADLTWAVAAINAWNRVAIAFRSEAGKYKPAAHG